MPEDDLTRTDRTALYIRARADAKAARDEAVRVVERENAALSEVPCARRPSARAKGLGASCGAGTAPADLTVTGLAKALPYSWAEQESSIGSRNKSLPRSGASRQCPGKDESIRARRGQKICPASPSIPNGRSANQSSVLFHHRSIDISKIPCKFPAPAKKFPARPFKNSLLRYVGNLAVSLWIHSLNGDENWRMSPKSSKIPCKFPASREFEVGDRSDQDCVVSQPVRSLRCDFQVWENRRQSRGLAGNGRVFGEENQALPTEGGVFLDESLLHEFSISGI